MNELPDTQVDIEHALLEAHLTAIFDEIEDRLERGQHGHHISVVFNKTDFYAHHSYIVYRGTEDTYIGTRVEDGCIVTHTGYCGSR